ncbi:MAG: hypothetical protein ABF335_10870 [Alphaproteobacteria bacterium]
MEKAPRYSLARLMPIGTAKPVNMGIALFALLTAIMLAGAAVFGGITEDHPFAHLSDGNDSSELLIGTLLNLILAFMITAHALIVKRRPPHTPDMPGGITNRLYPTMAIFGLVLTLGAPLLEVSDTTWNPYDLSLWWWAVGWHRILTGLLGWEGGMMVAAMLINADRLNRSAQSQPFNLFDRDTVAQTAKQGLFNALIVVLIPALLTPFLVDPRYWILFSAVMGIVVIFSLIGLLLPSLGLRKRIVAAKTRELEHIRAQIITAKASLDQSGEGAQIDNLATLNSLLDYQAHIRAIPDWPFDRSILTRYGIYLLIPLVTWTGGAIVENIIDGFLG